MELQVLCGALFWVLLPLSLLAACLFRYNVLSLIYLLFLLLLPLFCGPTAHSMRGHTGRLLKFLLSISIIFLCSHVIFLVCLHTVPGLDDLLGHNCSDWEVLARHVGVTRLDFYDIPNTVRMVAPDFGMFLVSAICLGLCNRLTRRPKCPTPHERLSRSSDLLEQQEEEEHQAEVTEDEDPEGEEDNEDIQMSPQDGVLASRIREAAHKLLEAVWKSLALLLLALAGITVPSGFSAVYYLAFVGLCTWWACHFPISHVGLNTLSVMVGFFAGGHIICLYGYQSPFIQNFFPPQELWARLFGLKDIIIHTNCTGSVDELILNQNHDWPVYVNPGILLLLYYAVISVLKLKTPSTERKGDGVETEAADPQKSAQEDLEMAEVETWTKERYSVGEETKPMLPPQTSDAAEMDPQDCTVHGIQPESGHNPADRKPDASKEQSPLLFLGNVILNQSYICALIAMMEAIKTSTDHIKTIEAQLASSGTPEELGTLKEQITKNIDKHRRDTEERKRSKFSRDAEDYESNNIYKWQDNFSTRRNPPRQAPRSSFDFGFRERKGNPLYGPPTFFRTKITPPTKKATRRGRGHRTNPRSHEDNQISEPIILMLWGTHPVHCLPRG